MWLKDDGGADIKGSVDVQEREGSIEIVGFSHGLNAALLFLIRITQLTKSNQIKNDPYHLCCVLKYLLIRSGVFPACINSMRVFIAGKVCEKYFL